MIGRAPPTMLTGASSRQRAVRETLTRGDARLSADTDWIPTDVGQRPGIPTGADSRVDGRLSAVCSSAIATICALRPIGTHRRAQMAPATLEKT